jgi:hypothetical protein
MFKLNVFVFTSFILFMIFIANAEVTDPARKPASKNSFDEVNLRNSSGEKPN